MTALKTRIGLGAGLVVALVGVTNLQARPAADELVRECELAIGVERVPVQAEPIAIPVRHSAALGDSVAISLPDESKVRVMGAARAGEDEPQTLRVLLNTSEAVAGTYAIVVGDGQTECKGTIQVGGDGGN